MCIFKKKNLIQLYLKLKTSSPLPPSNSSKANLFYRIWDFVCARVEICQHNLFSSHICHTYIIVHMYRRGRIDKISSPLLFVFSVSFWHGNRNRLFNWILVVVVVVVHYCWFLNFIYFSSIISLSLSLVVFTLLNASSNRKRSNKKFPKWIFAKNHHHTCWNNILIYWNYDLCYKK